MRDASRMSSDRHDSRAKKSLRLFRRNRPESPSPFCILSIRLQDVQLFRPKSAHTSANHDLDRPNVLPNIIHCGKGWAYLTATEWGQQEAFEYHRNLLLVLLFPYLNHVMVPLVDARSHHLPFDLFEACFELLLVLGLQNLVRKGIEDIVFLLDVF